MNHQNPASPAWAAQNNPQPAPAPKKQPPQPTQGGKTYDEIEKEANS